MFLFKIRKILAFITSIVVFICGGVPVVPENVKTQDDYVGLKDVYADYFDIGACTNSCYLDDPELVEFYLKNFSSVTPEWELKMEALHPTKDGWNENILKQMDRLADFCRENNMKIRGHCLVWAQQYNWMLYDDNGNFVDKEVFYQRQYEYFEKVMTRYGDVIKVWDVVNEPFGYDLKDGEFKQSDVVALCGSEYIVRAFQSAKEISDKYNLGATLVLNECGLAKNYVKQGYVLKYLKKWMDMGVPIDAIGIQGHSNAVSENETPERLDAFLYALEAIGVKNIQLTEIDMSLYFDRVDPSMMEIEDWMRDYQTLKYKHLFEVLRKHKDSITSVSFWGPDDGHSNLNNDNGSPEPLLFDKNHMPKAAYYAICDF